AMPPPPPPPEEKKAPDEPPPPPSALDTSTSTEADGSASGESPGPAAGPGLPATGPLGMNEGGEAGGDAFGLAARRGGRELLLTAPAGGAGNPTARFTEFAGLLQSHLESELNRIETLRESCYSVKVEVRVDAGGSLESVKIRSSTGVAALDAKIKAALLGLGPMSASPPADMPWPVGLRIVSRRADCS
ncbi:MAG TPA: TonB family protein, partial [Steroidobacteraceae bacterium]|nr:TonB family protein [Steroidobacteraceae bacterium]